MTLEQILAAIDTLNRALCCPKISPALKSVLQAKIKELVETIQL